MYNHLSKWKNLTQEQWVEVVTELGLAELDKVSLARKLGEAKLELKQLEDEILDCPAERYHAP